VPQGTLCLGEPCETIFEGSISDFFIPRAALKIKHIFVFYAPGDMAIFIAIFSPKNPPKIPKKWAPEPTLGERSGKAGKSSAVKF
jgi:hypothetical protein